MSRRHRYTNALAQETSPYLLQHAHNPVDWQPWTAAAFDRARAEDKPLLVSVGYSTCHWCHVMERESFEDEQVAAAMNRDFICVKVDREERPDVDALTMLAVQAMSGRGGWPSTVFMTADKQPFFAGTYFPARDGDRGARMGFLSILKKLAEAWRTERPRVLESAGEIAAELSSARRTPTPAHASLAVVDEAVQQVSARYDPRWGGLSPAPKFPSSLPIRVLLRHHARTGDAASLQMAHHTFAKMSLGGMYDHVAGGFCRYSTDERWLVPHFEKMLYDNALLVTAGVELFQVAQDAEVERVVRDVLGYVARDMTSPDGAFFSATDADSLAPSGEMAEGWFFTWTPDEVRDELRAAGGGAAFSAEDVGRVLSAWQISARGNFEGRNIPWLAAPADAPLRALLERARPVLLQARRERPPPLLDDKIIAAWNGLMISAFARAGRVFDEPRWVDAAVRALTFALTRMRQSDGRISRTWKNGSARHAGMLDDHANLCAAALDVFEATGADVHLDSARQIAAVVARDFADAEHGGWFATPHDGEQLLVREKETHDGSEPAGGSVHALNLARLGTLLTDAALLAEARRGVDALGQVLLRHPLALSELLLAVEFLQSDRRELVLVSRAAISADGHEAWRAVQRPFVPGAVLVHAIEGSSTPLAAGKVAIDGRPTLYVCRDGACERPVTDLPAIRAAAMQAAVLR